MDVVSKHRFNDCIKKKKKKKKKKNSDKKKNLNLLPSIRGNVVCYYSKI
jgi:peroxiredoxin